MLLFGWVGTPLGTSEIRLFSENPAQNGTIVSVANYWETHRLMTKRNLKINNFKTKGLNQKVTNTK